MDRPCLRSCLRFGDADLAMALEGTSRVLWGGRPLTTEPAFRASAGLPRGKRKVAESPIESGYAPPFDVMAGLVPAIHAAPLQTTLEVLNGFWAWIPGTRPGMTC
jgi:hypothetical protein